MKPILLDTNAYAAFKREIPPVREIIQNAPTIGVNTVVLGELFSGFAGRSKEQ
jgi:tRNA(fMet)-specific endonuclease VapC